MSDKFFNIPIERLWKHIIEEEKSGQIFGISRELFFTPHPQDPFKMQRYGETLQTPLGVAAGPHTQLAQNIISAWLTGARYIELKTIQTLDELSVSKPCIYAQDEGYNCEWSQELLIQQSFNQYLDAWILLHALQHKLHPHNQEERGFIFNISIGYNFQGIQNANVQSFLDQMENCKQQKEEKLDRLSSIYPQIKDIHIPDTISRNVTLSTMHGCPPDEIEKIASYLIQVRKYHTTIKLNPTLLGPQKVRDILNTRLRFKTQVPDQAFQHDLKYDDAIKIIQSLQTLAQQNQVQFSLKLTNTLETLNSSQVLPPNEPVVYMSGRALHPISINLAATLQEQFHGKLDISFSAGVDAFNVVPLLASGLKPVTICSDLLKPGGYGRIPQYIQHIRKAFKENDASDIHQFILKMNTNRTKDLYKAQLENLNQYAQHIIHPQHSPYLKTYFPGSSIKTTRPLTPFDCISAPCKYTCPAHQDVPLYISHVAAGNYHDALNVILQTNSLPSTTAKVCDHTCTNRCTRQNYDNSLHIRQIKHFALTHGQSQPPHLSKKASNIKVAVIGAGPSGLSCAYYLALRQVTVHIYEATNIAGGTVSHVIPPFRISPQDIQIDIQRIQALGVQIFYNQKINQEMFQTLRQTYSHIYIAVGASISTRLNIPNEDSPYVIDALTFLKISRLVFSHQIQTLQDNPNLPPIQTLFTSQTPIFSKKVSSDKALKILIVGGGNSAIDAARTARRLLTHPDSQVIILYRRTLEEMPADPQEIAEALHEGITIQQLTAPLAIQTPQLTHDSFPLSVTCCKMQLGEPDQSNRRRPIKIDHSEFQIEAHAVITAIGQLVKLDFIQDTPITDVRTSASPHSHSVLIGGDALRGPANIITGVADGLKAADLISPQQEKPISHSPQYPLSYYQKKAAYRVYSSLVPENQDSQYAIQEEAQRCLMCDDVCNVCVTLCPNRANVAYQIQPIEYKLKKVIPDSHEALHYHLEEDQPFQLKQVYQVVNIADFCNQCGNCQTFCPTAGAPFRDKPKICLTHESFQAEESAYFFESQSTFPCIRFKNGTEFQRLILKENTYIYETSQATIDLDKDTFNIQSVALKTNSINPISLIHAVQMSILLSNRAQIF